MVGCSGVSRYHALRSMTFGRFTSQGAACRERRQFRDRFMRISAGRRQQNAMLSQTKFAQGSMEQSGERVSQFSRASLVPHFHFSHQKDDTSPASKYSPLPTVNLLILTTSLPPVFTSPRMFIQTGHWAGEKKREDDLPEQIRFARPVGNKPDDIIARRFNGAARNECDRRCESRNTQSSRKRVARNRNGSGCTYPTARKQPLRPAQPHAPEH